MSVVTSVAAGFAPAPGESEGKVWSFPHSSWGEMSGSELQCFAPNLWEVLLMKNKVGDAKRGWKVSVFL